MAIRLANSNGGREARGQILKQYEAGVLSTTPVKIVGSEYQDKRTGNTNFIISIQGIGKETRMGPAKFVALAEAVEEIKQYFIQKGVLEEE